MQILTFSFAALAAVSFGKAIWPSRAAAVTNGETPISSASFLKLNPLAGIAFTQARLSVSRSLANSDITLLRFRWQRTEFSYSKSILALGPR